MRDSAAGVAGLTLLTGFVRVSVEPRRRRRYRPSRSISLRPSRPVPAEADRRGGDREGRLPSARHGLLGPLGRLRRPVPEEGHAGCGPAGQRRHRGERPGQRHHPATQAQAAITSGAKVIGITSLDSTTGDAIEKRRGGRGKTLDYDRLNLGGSASVYVSFNNVRSASSRSRLGAASAMARQEPAGLRARRLAHRQQRHPLRRGLQLGAQAALRRRQIQEGRRAGRS